MIDKQSGAVWTGIILAVLVGLLCGLVLVAYGAIITLSSMK